MKKSKKISKDNTPSNFIQKLQQRFKENFTFVVFEKKGWWREPKNFNYINGGFELEAQAYVIPPRASRPDVIYTSVTSKKKHDPKARELAAQLLIEKLRSLGVTI